MDLPPDCKSDVHTAEYYLEKLKEILRSDIPFDSICFKDASGTANQRKVFETLRELEKWCPKICYFGFILTTPQVMLLLKI